MTKKILVAALAAGMLALNAPAVSAHQPTFNCDMVAVQQNDVTGQNYEGVMYGYISHVDESGGPLTIECYVTVNGIEVASRTRNSVGIRTTVVVTADLISFSATPDDDVEICAFGTWYHGTTQESGTRCEDASAVGVLRTVHDLVVFVDPFICPVLASLTAELFDDVEIDAEGDVSVLGTLVWDCPPYGS